MSHETTNLMFFLWHKYRLWSITGSVGRSGRHRLRWFHTWNLPKRKLRHRDLRQGVTTYIQRPLLQATGEMDVDVSSVESQNPKTHLMNLFLLSLLPTKLLWNLVAQNNSHFIFSCNCGSWEGIGSSAAPCHVNWLQSSGGKLTGDVKNGSLRAWLRARWGRLGSPPPGVSTWLGLLTAGQLGSEREDLKGEYYKESKKKRPAFLKLRLRSPGTFCVPQSKDQSSHRVSPLLKSKEIELHLQMWEEACAWERGGIGDGHLWDKKLNCVIFKHGLHRAWLYVVSSC